MLENYSCTRKRDRKAKREQMQKIMNDKKRIGEEKGRTESGRERMRKKERLSEIIRKRKRQIGKRE